MRILRIAVCKGWWDGSGEWQGVSHLEFSATCRCLKAKKLLAAGAEVNPYSVQGMGFLAAVLGVGLKADSFSSQSREFK